jgi:hypothetical protein
VEKYLVNAADTTNSTGTGNQRLIKQCNFADGYDS